MQADIGDVFEMILKVCDILMFVWLLGALKNASLNCILV